MGLTNLSYGLYGGIVAFAVPQILSDRHAAPEAAIAGLTAMAFSPGFWAFVFSPMLDVRFSRRWYSVALACFAALTIVAAFLNLNHFVLLEILLTLGFFAAYLYQSALGGWLSTVVASEEENTLSVWITIGNTGGFAIIAISCNQLVSRVAPLTAALILGAVVLLPMVPFLFMPAPGPDRRLASESFTQFFGALWQLVKRREVLLAVILFLAPAGTFSLTNFLGSRGGDFHATPAFVGLVGGIGVAIGGISGALIFPLLSRLMALRKLYLSVAIVGSLGTLLIAALPHTPNTFAVLLISENLFQCLAITISMGIIFETIGRDNPLASTTFCFISSAYGVPIWYMLYVEAFGYSHGGITGSLITDALTGITASVLLGCLLWVVTRRSRRA
jgi:PAT family beta-lactamase induction signal transducer AmpG